MKIEFDDIITISFIERCDGKVVQTNIEEIAKENGFYNENVPCLPTAIHVGRDIFPRGLYDELVGKEIGDKGTVILPPEKAYGKRSDENIHSIHKREFSKIPKIGEAISHIEYGDGIVIKTIGSEVIIDFNHKFAGKELEYEYEIHDKITDPAEQFSSLVNRSMRIEHGTSFKDGDGIICIAVPKEGIGQWLRDRIDFAQGLFERHPSLYTLEFREKYENVFGTIVLDEADGATDSKEVTEGDLVTVDFVEHCDGEILRTSIEQVARDNDLYDEDVAFVPTHLVVRSEIMPEFLYDEFIGKKTGAKGTLILPADVVHGEQSETKVHSINRKDISTDVEIGSHIHHDKYGDGIVINTFGKRVIVDFNHEFAEKEVMCEYEILEIITDPAEKFFRLLADRGPQGYDVSFENGTGTISLPEFPLMAIEVWGLVRLKLALELFEYLPYLQTLEFREKYAPTFEEEKMGFLKNKDYMKTIANKIFKYIKK